MSQVAKPVMWEQGLPFDVQGHRGARGLRPENTLAGISCALEIGVASVECDVALSIDDAVILTHNGAVPYPVGAMGRGLSDGGAAPEAEAESRAEVGGADVPATVPVARLPLAALRQVDLGHLAPPTDDDAAGTFRGEPGQRITTLGAVLSLFELFDAKDVRLDVEIKSARHSDPGWDAAHVVGRVAAEIRSHGAVEMCSVRSFDLQVQEEARQQCPELSRVLLVGTGADHVPPDLALDPHVTEDQIIDMAEEIEASAVAPGRSVVSSVLVERAHARQLPVIPWTVNDRAGVSDMLDLGVDGICTDRPDVVRASLAEAGYPLPRRHRAPGWLGYGWERWPDVATGPAAS